MKVKWYGHAAFRIEAGGIRIILDPYKPGAYGGGIGYGRISDEADLVLVSHDHDDHAYVQDIKGRFQLIKEEGEWEVKGVKINGIPSFHDDRKGKERGRNLIFVVEAEGLRLAHMGDLGHTLDEQLLKRIGRVDIVLLPVGGLYTIDARAAEEVMDALGPSFVIPMHYKTEKCGFPIAPVEEFVKGKQYERVDGSEIEIRREDLGERRIVVLKHAL
jgi:L-ascorbate metabolism protein UlaG (beta-lactamase superfamily)